MEPPAPYNARTLRDEKAKVLCATRPVALRDTVCARYDGYLDAPGVSPDSQTPTFAALKLHVDNWRWQDVPFYLRSGKGMAEKASAVTIEFRKPPHELLRAFECPGPNVLSLCVQPDEGVHLTFQAKVPDQPRETRPVDLEFHYRSSFPDVSLPDAYERLLLDALASDASLFARSDEIENAWRLMDPVIEGWEDPGAPELATYAPGSWGPEEADELLARDGRVWRMECGGHG